MEWTDESGGGRGGDGEEEKAEEGREGKSWEGGELLNELRHPPPLPGAQRGQLTRIRKAEGG